MEYHICIDQGNTAAKVSVHRADSGECALLEVFRPLRPSDIDALAAKFNLAAAIFSSVKGDGAAICEHLRRFCPLVICLSADTPTPLTLGYTTPQTLGVDRIAAAVGAATLPETLGHDILIADIGTAITYDHVTADGVFVGGNIAPGIFMRLNALNHYTARLPLVEPAPTDILWGTDTRSALLAGAINGVLAEIAYYRSQLSPETITIITGGASSLVIDRVPEPYLHRPHLVNKGLEAIITYNRKITCNA